MAIASTSSPTSTILNQEDSLTIRRVVDQLVGHFGFASSEQHDLEQELALDLVKRLPEFDPQKSKRSTFVWGCLNHKVSNLIRSRHRECREPLRMQRFGTEDEAKRDSRVIAENSLLDHRAEEAFDKIDLRLDIQTVLASLTERQRKICALLPDKTAFAISKMLSVSKQEIYTEIQRIQAVFISAGLGRKK